MKPWPLLTDEGPTLPRGNARSPRELGTSPDALKDAWWKGIQVQKMEQGGAPS